jgi:hypothetical protein
MAYLYRTHAARLLSQRTLFAYSTFLQLLSETVHGTVRFFTLATIFVRGERMKVLKFIVTSPGGLF